MEKKEIKDLLENKYLLPLNEFYKRRIIVWDDPDKEFTDEVEGLELENAKVIILNGKNFFATKKLVLEDEPTTNFLIYCPLKFEKEEDNWLIDIFEYSEHYKVDYISGLIDEIKAVDSLMIRNTIKLYSKFFQNKSRLNKFKEIVGEVKNSKDIHLGVLAVLTNSKGLFFSNFLLNIFKEGPIEGNKIINSIESFGNLVKFKELILKITGYADDSLDNLLKYICITALGQTMNGGILNSYYPKYFNEKYISNCYNIVEDWFQSDFESSSELLKEVGKEINIISMLEKMSISEICNSDVFPHINGSLLVKLLLEISNEVIKTKDNIDLINRRRTMRFYGEYKYYFEGVYYISLMQEMYSKYKDFFHMIKPIEVWKAYEDDLYKFDTYYRKFNYFFNLSLQKTNIHIDDLFKQCADYIEKIYKNWYLFNLNSNWNNSSKDELKEQYWLLGIANQIDFFTNYVSKEIEEKITFVIVSDALRYEVGKELFEKLTKNARSKVSITSMQVVFPSITEYGMAALLPGKKELSTDGNVLVNGLSTDGIANRNSILQAYDSSFIGVSYDNFIKLKKEQKADLIKGKKLVYIYHDEIDERGHSSEEKVFDACEDTISNLVNLVNVLNSLRASSKIIITADHGFLYNSQPLSETSKISVNDISDKYKFSRRYLIGTENNTNENLMAIKMLINTGDNKYKGFTPFANVRIKMPGGEKSYVHGGVSLEEIMIPVISYENVRSGSKEYDRNQEKYDKKIAKIQLIGDNRKIANLNFPLNFYQSEPVGNTVNEATYEIFMQDKMGKTISNTKYVIADKKDNDDSSRIFKVMLTLKNQQFNNLDNYYLMIVNKDTRDVLERIEFKIEVFFSLDFDF